MANSDGTIYINTEIDASGFDDILKELDKDAQVMSKTAESMGKEISNSFGDGVEGMADPIQNEAVGMQQKLSSLSGSMTKLGGTLSLAFTAPLTALGGKMVDAASDMEENINKVDVAFGKSSESVKAWAETATEAFGLSKNQALEATSLFGDMGTSMGLPQEEAAKMATSMAGLAGDLASFKNIGIDQAMTALNGVFTGETESLKTLGVVMTETNLKQFAADVGIVYDEMTQAEKVQLRYAYVMEMTKNAQGDYARTSDGTANSMRTMSATLDNLIAVFGQSLLPAITPVIQFITDLLTKFSELDPGIQQIIVIIGAVVAAIGPVITAVGGIISVISTLIPIFSAIIGGLNPVILIIGAVVAAIALLIANWDKIKATMQAFVEFIKDAFVKDWTESFGVFGNVINMFFDNVQAIWDMVKGIFEGVITFVKGVFTGDWDKAWEGIKKIFSSVFNGISAVCRNIVQTIYNVIIGIVEKNKS
ncbi:MAG: phage tail tape measure protein [Lachnospiraceae bacterium]|nr:phage tail tape measure protein [Lachnospiraceae bacterium]